MDTNYPHTEAWARAFGEVGYRVPRVGLHRQIGKGCELLIREFVEDDDKVEKIQGLHSPFFADLQVCDQRQRRGARAPHEGA